MNLVIKKYPYNKDCVLAITIDDLHPESKHDLDGLDFGFDFKSLFWKQINSLIKFQSDIKFNLFAVADWIDRREKPNGIFSPLRKINFLRRRPKYNTGKFAIDSSIYKNWVENINQKVSNIEISMHGLNHINNDLNLPKSQEFFGINNNEMKSKIDKMIDIFVKSGINFYMGFRFPGWGYSSDLLDYLCKGEIKFIAGSSDFRSDINNKYSRGAGIPNQKICDINILDNEIFNFVANCYPEQIDRAIDIAKNDGIIIIHSHIAKTTLGLKTVDKKFSRNIIKIIKEIKFQTLKDIWFAKLGEITDFFNAKKCLEYNIFDNSIEFFNNSDIDLLGLTVVVDNKTYVIDKICKKSKIILNLCDYNDGKLVSIVLTVYNGENDIINSLDSLVHQTHNNTEIIIINDGSTDSTKEKIEEYIKLNNDSRIHLINKENSGRANSKNIGLANARGEFIAFCEDDAIYSKDYIKNAICMFDNKENPVCGVIGPHYVLNKNETINTRAKDIERRRNFLNYKPNSCWIYKRDLLMSVGGFNEKLEFGEDIEPAIKLKRLGYNIIFNNNCLWLHKEPSSFFKYLRRKFKGGIGMAYLERMKLKKNTIKIWHILFLFTCLFALFLLIKNELYFIFPVFILFLLFIRINDIIKVHKYTNENIFFVCIAAMLEYVWWGATFSGYVYGGLIDKNNINKILIKR